MKAPAIARAAQRCAVWLPEIQRPPEARALTLQSRRTHNGGARLLASARPCRRCVPLTSNVRPLMHRMKRAVRNSVAHRAVAAGAAWSRPCVALQSLSVGAGRPSAGGRRAAASPEALLQHQRGLSVLRRPSRHWLALKEKGTLAPCRTQRLREATLEHNSHIPGFCAVTPQKFGSLALRSTAAPARWFGAGTGFARAGGVGALGYQGNARTGCPHGWRWRMRAWTQTRVCVGW